MNLFCRKTNLNFVGRRKLFFTLSAIIIAIGPDSDIGSPIVV